MAACAICMLGVHVGGCARLHDGTDGLDARPSANNPDNGDVQPLSGAAEGRRRTGRRTVIAHRLQERARECVNDLFGGCTLLPALLQLRQRCIEAHAGEVATIARVL